jgi:hypothetical protein
MECKKYVDVTVVKDGDDKIYEPSRFDSIKSSNSNYKCPSVRWNKAEDAVDDEPHNLPLWKMQRRNVFPRQEFPMERNEYSMNVASIKPQVSGSCNVRKERGSIMQKEGKNVEKGMKLIENVEASSKGKSTESSCDSVLQKVVGKELTGSEIKDGTFDFQKDAVESEFITNKSEEFVKTSSIVCPEKLDDNSSENSTLKTNSEEARNANKELLHWEQLTVNTSKTNPNDAVINQTVVDNDGSKLDAHSKELPSNERPKNERFATKKIMPLLQIPLQIDSSKLKATTDSNRKPECQGILNSVKKVPSLNANFSIRQQKEVSAKEPARFTRSDHTNVTNLPSKHAPLLNSMTTINEKEVVIAKSTSIPSVKPVHTNLSKLPPNKPPLMSLIVTKSNQMDYSASKLPSCSRPQPLLQLRLPSRVPLLSTPVNSTQFRSIPSQPNWMNQRNNFYGNKNFLDHRFEPSLPQALCDLRNIFDDLIKRHEAVSDAWL